MVFTNKTPETGNDDIEFKTDSENEVDGKYKYRLKALAHIHQKVPISQKYMTNKCCCVLLLSIINSLQAANVKD